MVTKIRSICGNGNQGYILLDNWTECNHKNDQNGQGKRNKFATVIQSINQFRIYYKLQRNLQHSRADIFDLRRESGESPGDVWKRKQEVDENVSFGTMTAAELLASKFQYILGKSTGDYELQKRPKSDLTVETIFETIHESMYVKLNDSPETKKRKKIRYEEKGKLKYTNEQTDRNSKTGKLENWKTGLKQLRGAQLSHTARLLGKRKEKSEPGHLVKCCCSTREKNHQVEEESNGAEGNDWSPDKLHSIQQKTHSMGTKNKSGPPFYAITLLVKNRPINIKVDTGPQVTLFPKSNFNNKTTEKQ